MNLSVKLQKLMNLSNPTYILLPWKDCVENVFIRLVTNVLSKFFQNFQNQCFKATKRHYISCWFTAYHLIKFFNHKYFLPSSAVELCRPKSRFLLLPKIITWRNSARKSTFATFLGNFSKYEVEKIFHIRRNSILQFQGRNLVLKKVVT